MKFCINCKSYRSTTIPNDDDGYCESPALGINLVTGKVKTILCSSHRLNMCGEDARFFEQGEQHGE
jgi:hypothetical protein